ncbi:MAG: YdiU family protein [Gammaproteobacteria bacterium]|nr:YdiU family protein [Gammaproteobacteria bacterium]
MYTHIQIMKHTLSTLPLSNSFVSLGDSFFSRVYPTPFETPAVLIHFNTHAAELLDLDPAIYSDSKLAMDLATIFSGKKTLPGSEPIAMLYAGHQFGHYVPQLGDGRAIILGETINQRGERWEIQLKGSGLTPYSRDGDGRAVLRSTIREYLCSEAMHAMGIPTTRALCIVGSADPVYRERIEPGAMLTRLAPSHVRFGSFEVFYYRNQFEHIRKLADFVIEHHYPQLLNEQNRYAAWLECIIARTASLIAQWQAVGFSHGVMNSDNMSVLGLTIDYGPYGFMEAYDPGYICNHSDHHGRYAYGQQPDIGLFNLSCFAQAILPLLSEEPEQAVEIAKDKLAQYYSFYIEQYALRMRAKLGLQDSHGGDEQLVKDLFALMADDKVDFTILFRRLSEFSTHDNVNNNIVRDLFVQREAFDQWADRYKARLLTESSLDEARSKTMKQVNPKYILRNYMAEIAIRKAEDENDYSEIGRLLDLLHNPFDEQPEHEHYAGFPPDWAGSISVSCSS